MILTLLPAFDLPVDLKVIKNNLGIPHQLPPRFENACLYFGKFMYGICIIPGLVITAVESYLQNLQYLIPEIIYRILP